MSCGDTTTEKDAIMPRRRKYDKSKTCVKCKERAGNVVIRHAVYCRDCFVPLMTFRFRRSLEPFVNPKPDGPRRTALKPTGNLLIGLSGGLGSTVLLDLVHRCYVTPDPALLTSDGGRDHPRHERVWKTVHVCYVEACDAIPGMKDHTSEVRSLVEALPDVEFIPLRIQNAFDPSWWETITGRREIHSDLMISLVNEDLPFLPPKDGRLDPDAALRSYLSSLPTATALPATLSTLTRVLLQWTAIATQSSHLLLGTSLTSLAISLISSIAQGGGFHVKEETQEEWSPSITPVGWETRSAKTVRIIRPLRDVNMKECAVWAWWNRLHVVGKSKWEWPGTKPGVGRLTKDFIIGLEKDYPSTVSTIVRTCGKLAPKGDSAGACLICQRSIQEGMQSWKSRIAIRSRNAVDTTSSDLASESNSLTSSLCYVCHTTLVSKAPRPPPALYPSEPGPSSSISLPAWASYGVASLSSHGNNGSVLDGNENEVVLRKKFGQLEMHDVVKEFILDD